MRVPNASPALANINAPMAPENLASTGAGVWRKARKAFPGSKPVLSATKTEQTSWGGWATWRTLWRGGGGIWRDVLRREAA